jgi:hypothetical protein
MDLFHRRTVAALAVGLLIQAVGPAPAQSQDWSMAFSISIPDPNTDSGRLSNHLEAGVFSSGTDRYDNDSDVVALLAGPLQAAFTHEGETSYPGYLQWLWRDIRADGIPKTWKINVASQQSGSPITVEWTTPPSIPSDACHLGVVSFQDQTTGQLIDLNANSTYSYVSNGTVGNPEVRSFTLTVNSIPHNSPATPTGLQSKSQRFQTQLKWTANSETNLTGYHVWRSTSSGSGYKLLNAVPVHKTQYLDRHLRSGTTYYYTLKAVGANGCESGFSQQTAAIAK